MKILSLVIISVMVFFKPVYATTKVFSTHSTVSVIELLADARLKQKQGFLSQAQEISLLAYEKAQSDKEKVQATLLLSQIAYQSGNNEKALYLLEQLDQMKNTEIKPYILLQKANIALADNNLNLATTLYLKIIESSDIQLSVASHINLATLQNKELAKKLLQTAYKMMEDIPQSDKKIELYLSIAQVALEFNPQITLNCLKTLAQINLSKQARYLSQTYGLKSKLYFKHGNLLDALSLIHKAIFYAQQEPDLLMRWEWFQGKILTQNKPDKAIAAYRRAILHLNKIRNDIPIRYTDGRSSFRDLLSPLYLELTDLLLTQAKNKNSYSQDQIQALLVEAQNTIELFKVSELLDYFKNSCAVIQYPLMDLTKNSPKTAIIYPIVFDDRLEILLSINGVLKSFSVDVKKINLYNMAERAVYRLRPRRGVVRTFNPYETNKLYTWLIQPIKKELEKNKIDTLVFVPDDTLRTVPIAMLWDGQQYLIENYAIATLPGLSLLDPKPIATAQLNISLAGISLPGEVVNQLPKLLDLSFINTNFIQLAQQRHIQIRKLNLRQLNLRKLPDSLRGLEIREQAPIELNEEKLRYLQDSLALPGVVDELNSIASIMPSTVLLDNQFQLSSFKNNIKGARIIHIASHAIFSGKPESSFIMAHDKILDMDQIDSLFKAESFSQSPVELLTLSACQTAIGDDRSPLGLAGVALKSGARSIMGSLWSISDNAAKMLFPIFYQQLVKNKLSKAKSLQKAQISLLKSEEMKHPFYWAPFILIGNWM